MIPILLGSCVEVRLFFLRKMVDIQQISTLGLFHLKVSLFHSDNQSKYLAFNVRNIIFLVLENIEFIVLNETNFAERITF